MIKTASLALLMCIHASTVSGYDVPYVLGTGQLLSAAAKEKILQELQKNESPAELEKFRKSFNEGRSRLTQDYEGNRPGVSIYRFESVAKIADILAQGATKGSTVYYLCFDCREGFPSEAVRKSSERTNTSREIWVLSGYGVSIEMPANKLRWRVLYSGAAE